MSRAWRNSLKLVCWAISLWLFFAVITPRLVALSPSWQRYDAVQEQYGLDSGALYYSNVPVTQDAESATREAVREGMIQRRAAAMERAGNAGR